MNDSQSARAELPRKCVERRIPARIAPALALLAAGLCANAARAAQPDSAAVMRRALHDPASRESAPLFQRRDALFAIAAVSAVAFTAPQDERLAHDAATSSGATERTLARSVQPLGNLGIVVPALAASWLVARASGRIETAGAIFRVGASVGAAGAGALAIKQIAGRPRPIQSPGDSDDLHPFSGYESFPSGHAAVSFALATAINRESSWRGTPWITYPLATLVGWSRVHDRKHWTSDVVAGAALGIWTAHKVEDVMQPPRSTAPAHLGVGWRDGGPAVAITFAR
jgi:membrane-associated phospholipid phosphatase